MPWSDDELRMIHQVAKTFGLTPYDEYLPVAERLVERGVLVRLMFDGEPVYFTSKAFREKAEQLAQHQVNAAERARLN